MRKIVTISKKNRTHIVRNDKIGAKIYTIDLQLQTTKKNKRRRKCAKDKLCQKDLNRCLTATAKY